MKGQFEKNAGCKIVLPQYTEAVWGGSLLLSPEGLLCQFWKVGGVVFVAFAVLVIVVLLVAVCGGKDSREGKDVYFWWLQTGRKIGVVWVFEGKNFGDRK